MVKVRNNVKDKDIKDLENFVSGANTATAKGNDLDPNGKRDKKILISFNQYEIEEIEKASVASDRPKANFIRWSAMELAREINNEEN
jgi:hypothetical protein